MADSTDPTAPSPETNGWCHWHRGPSGTALRIRTTPRTSGSDSPANTLYACAPCREQRGLTAAEQATS